MIKVSMTDTMFARGAPGRRWQ